ncbi:MAG: ABATE domain-containing protein [Mycobacterium sp.]|uniref:CGNR zinc finger domain-containing protein n=1 Tax=Mycobacterium sp. TaxID=1785 RepID=UPI003C334ADB
MTFVYVGGRHCLNFVGTMKHRDSSREELLNKPELLSDWAVQGGLLDVDVAVTADDLAAATELREAIYRTVIARLKNRRPPPADVQLLNEQASQPQLTPRLLRTGATRREGTASRLLASLAADLLDLLGGTDIDNVKQCAHPDCTRLYLDASRAKNRHWCGMGTCGNKAKVQAFRARQRASSG